MPRYWRPPSAARSTFFSLPSRGGLTIEIATLRAARAPLLLGKLAALQALLAGRDDPGQRCSARQI